MDEARSTVLDRALYEWRRGEFDHFYPDCCDDMWVGDWFVLPYGVIDDTIYLSHLNKLMCHDKFIQLVDWIHHECYASELLPIIHKNFPPPPEPPMISPNAPRMAESNLCVTKCLNCWSPCHNGMYLSCFSYGTS